MHTGANIGDSKAGGDSVGAVLVVPGEHDHPKRVGRPRPLRAPLAAPERVHRRSAARPHLVLKCEHPATHSSAVCPAGDARCRAEELKAHSAEGAALGMGISAS